MTARHFVCPHSGETAQCKVEAVPSKLLIVSHAQLNQRVRLFQRRADARSQQDATQSSFVLLRKEG